MPIELPDGLGPALASRGWKKLGQYYYVDLNGETMAHILPYWQGSKAERLHAQLGTTNKRLNRVSWDVCGLPPAFGTRKDHLVNGSKCFLWGFYRTLAFEAPLPAADQLAEAMILACRENSAGLAPVSAIRDRIARMPPEAARHHDRDSLCIALAEEDLDAARAILARNKDDPSFDISFFAHVERLLGRAP